MQPRTNVIMSHGGRHGPGGTYLRGAKVDRETSEHIPNTLLTGSSLESWAGQEQGKMGAKAQEHRRRKAAERAAKGVKAPKPPPKPPHMPRTASNEGEAERSKVDPTAAELTKGAEGGSGPPPPPPPPAAESPKTPEAPTSRRQLTLMRKDELIRLAESVDVDVDGTAEDVRSRLRVHFFGEDDED